MAKVCNGTDCILAQNLEAVPGRSSAEMYDMYGGGWARAGRCAFRRLRRNWKTVWGSRIGGMWRSACEQSP